MTIGNQWIYEEANYGYVDTITIVDTRQVNGKTYYAMKETSKPGYMWFRKEADKVYIVDTVGYQLSTSMREFLLYDFSTSSGDTMYVPVTNVELTCDYHGAIILISKNDSVITPAGTFLNCFYFSQNVPCIDAGRFNEWFAPGIGRVAYYEFNFAGILEYYLSYSSIITKVSKHPIFEYKLSQNYPNPFNPTTTIKYSIPQNNFVSLIVYDILGKAIKTLVNEEKTAGEFEVNFDASNLSSGVYFYRIQAGSYTQAKKLILLK